jgi:Anti-sigma regulatory factor (Ser/Thr protein kinase)
MGRMARMGIAEASDLYDTVLLVTSELVTNAVIHAGEHKGELLDLLLIDNGSCLRVAVIDSDPEHWPTPRDPDFLTQSGRGLFLLRMTVSRWGVEENLDDESKTVWAEIDYSLE